MSRPAGQPARYGAAEVLKDIERGAEPMSLKQARTCPELARGGKEISPATFDRYMKVGLNGHRLETAWGIGGAMTTLPAIRRFLARINGVRPAKSARVSHEQAMRELEKAGI
jgi:hypothetical protein